MEVGGRPNNITEGLPNGMSDKCRGLIRRIWIQSSTVSKQVLEVSEGLNNLVSVPGASPWATESTRQRNQEITQTSRLLSRVVPCL